MSNDTNVYGLVTEVSEFNVGESVTAAASVGATVLAVEDPTTFHEAGGQVAITGETYTYTGIDEPAGTITLDASTPLTVAVAVDDRVEIYPAAPLKQALVDFDIEESEAVWVTVPHALAATLQTGRREEGDREAVLLQERAVGDLYMADIQAATGGVFTLGTSADLDAVILRGIYAQGSDAGAASGLNYPVPYAGFLEVLVDPATGFMRMQRYTGYETAPSIWVRTWNASTGWNPWVLVHKDDGIETDLADIAVAGSGWSFTSAQMRMYNKNCSFRLAITRTSATVISIPANGNVTNTVLGQMVQKYRPGVGFDQGGIVTGSTGPLITVIIGGDGTLTMVTAQPPSGSIVQNDTFVIGGSYMMA